MRSKLLLMYISLLLVSAIQVLASTKDSPLFTRLPNIPFDGPEPVDGTYMLGPKEAMVRQKAALHGVESMIAEYSSLSSDSAQIGDEYTINVYDLGLGTKYDETFTVTLKGSHGIILVTKEAYDGFDGEYYRFANPIGDDSEPWLRKEDLLTPAQLSYLLSEFDDNIYPTNTKVFGEHLPRGSEGQKVWILLHNIRDVAYYDPEATMYVAGYFSAGEDLENNKNMMHIDTYDWLNRTGPDSKRPYLYEGTFAHEFEHLIHFDRDPDEPIWVNEGCADLAGYICGYGHPRGHVVYYIAFHPIVSLKFWGGGLADYGAAYLFLLYLYEKYGGETFITDLVFEQTNGIEGIQNTLNSSGHCISFNRLFDNWTIANYLDNTSFMDGRYGYESIEIGSDDSYGYTIASALELIWGSPYSSAPFNISSDWTGADPLPYTAHYFPFYNDKIAKLTAAGDEFAGVLPYSGKYEWYSGMDAWAWRGISQSFEIPSGGATLNFMTYYEIEDDWDYGYVEVYDHNTGQWYTLDGPGTINTLPNPQDNPNVPAEREPTAYFENGRWHAFTGKSGGWQEITMDLSPFSGHKVDIYFRSWQDGYFSYQMMYVDDISIPEIGFFDDVESEHHNWTVEDWSRSDGKLPNSLGVLTFRVFDPPEPEEELTDKFLNDFENLQWHRGKFLPVQRMRINPETQRGRCFILPACEEGEWKNVTVVTNHTNHILTSHYELETKLLTRRRSRIFKR